MPRSDLVPGLHAKELSLQTTLHRLRMQPPGSASTSHCDAGQPSTIIAGILTLRSTLLMDSEDTWSGPSSPGHFKLTRQISWLQREKPFTHNNVHRLCCLHTFCCVQFFLSTDNWPSVMLSWSSLQWASMLLPATAAVHWGAPPQVLMNFFFFFKYSLFTKIPAFKQSRRQLKVNLKLKLWWVPLTT